MRQFPTLLLVVSVVHRVLLAVVLGVVAACGAAEAGPSHAPDAAAAAPDALADPGPDPGLYAPAATYAVDTLAGLQLLDPSRSRTIAYDVVYPTDAPGPRPVIVWSHGGVVRGGTHDGTDGWSELLAGAGYVVIVPSHTPERHPTAFTPMCVDNAIPDDECAIWIAMFTHRPIDVSFVIDSLAVIEAASPALTGRFDVERIGVGGHSAGTTSGLSLLGGIQQWVPGAGPYSHVDARVDAVLAASPQGPTRAGFASGFRNQAFVPIDRPMLSITGAGDDTGEPAVSRRLAFETAVPGDLYLSWDLDASVHHAQFNREDCAGDLAAHCDAFGAIGIAFFDAYLRELPGAATWLASGEPGALAGGALQFSRR